MDGLTVGQDLVVSVILPLVHEAVVQLLTFQDSPFFLGGSTSLQSRVVVPGVADVVEVDGGLVVVRGTELEIVFFVVVLTTVVVECAVVLGVGVVGHGFSSIST